MPVTEFDSISAVSISTTEISLISGTSTLATDTTNGIFHAWLDPVAASLTKGDYFEFRVYEKVEATGGTKKCVFRTVIGNAQVEPIIFPPMMLKNGWDMTLKKLAGTDRSWDASIRGVQATISEPYELDAVTVTETELSIVSGTTTLQNVTDDGVYQLFVDGGNMVKGDIFIVRAYEKVLSGSTKRQVFEQLLQGVQACNWVSPQFTLMHGWDMTLQRKTGVGADRAFDASIRKVN